MANCRQGKTIHDNDSWKLTWLVGFDVQQSNKQSSTISLSTFPYSQENSTKNYTWKTITHKQKPKQGVARIFLKKRVIKDLKRRRKNGCEFRCSRGRVPHFSSSSLGRLLCYLSFLQWDLPIFNICYKSLTILHFGCVFCCLYPT